PCGILDELVIRVVFDPIDPDDQMIIDFLGLYRPDFYDAFMCLGFRRRGHAKLIWWGHPVQWLIRATVGMHKNAPIGFDHDEAFGRRQERIEAASVGYGTFGNDKS